MKKERVQHVRVALVDDEPLARRGMRRVLEDIHGIDVVGDSNGEEAFNVLWCPKRGMTTTAVLKSRLY